MDYNTMKMSYFPPLKKEEIFYKKSELYNPSPLLIQNSEILKQLYLIRDDLNKNLFDEDTLQKILNPVNKWTQIFNPFILDIMRNRLIEIENKKQILIKMADDYNTLSTIIKFNRLNMNPSIDDLFKKMKLNNKHETKLKKEIKKK